MCPSTCVSIRFLRSLAYSWGVPSRYSKRMVTHRLASDWNTINMLYDARLLFETYVATLLDFDK